MIRRELGGSDSRSTLEDQVLYFDVLVGYTFFKTIFSNHAGKTSPNCFTGRGPREVEFRRAKPVKMGL